MGAGMIETLLLIYVAVVAFLAIGGTVSEIWDSFKAPPEDLQ